MSGETGTTILGENVDEPATPQSTDTTDNVDSYFVQLVGEGKRYSDQEALAKAKAEADSFIETLKTEKRDLEAQFRELSARSNVEEELLASIKSLQSNKPETSNQDEPEPEGVTVNPMTPEQMEAMVQKVLQDRDTLAQHKEQSTKAWQMLSEAAGSMDLAKEKVRAYIGGNQNKAQALEFLGRSDPDAFVALIKDKMGADGIATESGSGTSFGTETPHDGKMTWSKAKQIKKDNPELFNSRTFQVSLHRAVSQNPNFYDG